MSVWIDLKYVRRISPSLLRYKETKTSPFNALCRCPICGDSKKSKNKTRGSFYEYSNGIYYKCFNCMADSALHLGQFLADQFPFIYKEYRVETYAESRPKIDTTQKNKTDIVIRVNVSKIQTLQKNEDFWGGAIPILELPNSHYAKKYIASRKIQNPYIKNIRYVSKFFNWASKNTDSIVASNSDHSRIILPWFSETGEIFAYQARALHGEEPKYYTIVLNAEIPKFFGMQTIDYNKKIYVVEGPLDSLCLGNSIAVGSSNLISFAEKSDNVVYCYDNERRSEQILKLIKKTIQCGKRVFIPPKSWKYKDFNDAMKDGWHRDDILKIIDDNTYIGLSAMYVFSNWSKF
jgi:hypothetical protein